MSLKTRLTKENTQQTPARSISINARKAGTSSHVHPIFPRMSANTAVMASPMPSETVATAVSRNGTSSGGNTVFKSRSLLLESEVVPCVRPWLNPSKGTRPAKM